MIKWGLSLSTALLAAMMLIMVSCKEMSVDPRRGVIEVTIPDTGVTRLTVRIRVEAPYTPWTLVLQRDSVELLRFTDINAVVLDTLIFDYTSGPHHRVTYVAYYYVGGSLLDSSAHIVATTQDTTSHAFTWESFELGLGGSTVEDVSVVNDTCVWVAGSFEYNDPTSPITYPVHGAAEWNGREWKFYELRYQLPGYSQPSQGASTAVIAFSHSNVYLAAQGCLLHWDGDSMRIVMSSMGTPVSFGHYVWCIWGRDADDIYLGCDRGVILHVQGPTTELLRTGSEFRVTDIYGGFNPKTGVDEILVSTDSIGGGYFGELYSIEGSNVVKVSEFNSHAGLRTVWCDPGEMYFAGGLETFVSDGELHGGWRQSPEMYWTGNGVVAVRGKSSRDYWALSGGNVAMHFNGLTPRIFTIPDAPAYWRMSVRGDFVALAGGDGFTGRVTLFHR